MINWRKDLQHPRLDFFSDLSREWDFFGRPEVVLPAANIRETDHAYLIELAVPGGEKSDWDVAVKDQVLTISGDKKTENQDAEAGKWLRREFSYSGFRRSFTLPEQVDAELIKASYVRGVLLIELPKKVETASGEKRQILVQ
jgi:HSP20 family protein